MHSIAITGAKGLVASNCIPKLSESFAISQLHTADGFDIRDKNSVFEKLSEIDPDIVIHFAGKANVDGCEEDRPSDSEHIGKELLQSNSLFPEQFLNNDYWKNSDSAFALNVYGTANIASYCGENKKKLLYISTDFVFEGIDKEYNEDDNPNPINWYGKTKWWGELVVQKILTDSLVVRISYPYGDRADEKRDFLSKIAKVMQTKEEIGLINDMIITPTYIPDIADAIILLVKEKQRGIFHASGASAVSPFQIGQLLKQKFSLPIRVNPVSGDTFFANRAPRPFHLNLKNDKLSKLGYKPLTIDEGIENISV